MKRIFGIFLVLGLCGGLLAQSSDNHDVTISIDDIAVCDLNNTTTVELDVQAPTNPGDPPVGETDNSKRLWYTVVSDGVTQKEVTAQMDAGDATPAGTQLRLSTTPEASQGSGTSDVVLVAGSASDVITSIPSCYTGRTGSDGAVLTYEAYVNDATALVAGASSTVTVTLTIQDE